MSSLEKLAMPGMSPPAARIALCRSVLRRLSSPSDVGLGESLTDHRVGQLSEGARQLDHGAGRRLAPDSAPTALARRLGRHVAGATTEVTAPATRAHGGQPASATRPHARSLVEQRGVGDGPALVDVADARIVVDDCVAEEHLAEHGVAGHLPQRADLDAGLVHVETRTR